MIDNNVATLLTTLFSWIIMLEGLVLCIGNIYNIRHHLKKAWVIVEIVLALNGIIWFLIYSYVELGGGSYSVWIGAYIVRPTVIVLLSACIASTFFIRRKL